MVDVAVGRGTGTHSLRDDLADLDDPLTAVQAGDHLVADGDGGGWLRRAPVDLDVATPDRGGSVGACLGEPDGVQPLIDADGVDASDRSDVVRAAWMRSGGPDLR